MRKLKLRNAKIETLTANKVKFIGELKSNIYKLSYTVDKATHEALLQIKRNEIYNIWEVDGNLRFIKQW